MKSTWGLAELFLWLGHRAGLQDSFSLWAVGFCRTQLAFSNMCLQNETQEVSSSLSQSKEEIDLAMDR